MGLDMYLEAEVSVHTSKYGSDSEKELNETLRELADALGLPADNAGKGNYGSVVSTIAVHAGYWRKANAIHAWFVRECQDGVDECQRTEVELDKLRELRSICQQVLTGVRVANGPVQTGTVLAESEDMTITTSEVMAGEPIIEEGAVVTNQQLAAELLPTESGFFFGPTDYDAYYLEDVGHTVDVIDRCIAADLAAKERGLKMQFFYHSSW